MKNYGTIKIYTHGATSSAAANSKDTSKKMIAQLLKYKRAIRNAFCLNSSLHKHSSLHFLHLLRSGKKKKTTKQLPLAGWICPWQEL